MASIIRGTTPTVKFTFSKVSPSQIAAAFLLVKQDDRIVIEKTLPEATVGETSITWRLAQGDTLKLAPKKNATLTCDWRTVTGVRSKSKTIAAMVESGGKDEII